MTLALQLDMPIVFDCMPWEVECLQGLQLKKAVVDKSPLA